MLPDGAHKRGEDWTVFFLNRPGMAPKVFRSKNSKNSGRCTKKKSHPNKEGH
jgi:hypothetical protein